MELAAGSRFHKNTDPVALSFSFLCFHLHFIVNVLFWEMTGTIEGVKGFLNWQGPLGAFTLPRNEAQMSPRW